tara:strand:- start:922 stop:1419 length:498 start_codon:yes stop_codon:yes gene_type:complete
MAVIKPTFTLTANKSSSSTNPGPLSVALSLSASDLLTVDNVRSEIITPATGGGTAPTLIIDGSTLDGTETGGTDGGYIWMKNTTSSGANLIYVGITPARHASSDPTAPGNGGAATGLDGTTAESYRTFTLARGEFAYFPFDYLGDVYCFANAASQQLEYWIFDRG